MADLKDDIEKYLRGELSPEARHALERKALNDPFLSDTLDGAESVSPADFEADLQALQTKLHNRIGRTGAKVVPLWIWSARIAAGLVLIAISTFVVLQIFHADTQQGELAQHKEAPSRAPIVKDSIADNSPGRSGRDETAVEQRDEDSATHQGGPLSLAEEKKSDPGEEKAGPPATASAPARPAEAPEGQERTGSAGAK
ncbi:MAG TPA: hypothetical protein VD816_04330, partial [Ohtaekwangia sp.]|nr:hypothetical protein [Ohtaekwangia sp.]